MSKLEAGLEFNPDFVKIAGRWFPRALLIDVNTGHLNLAEAILDMIGWWSFTHDGINQTDRPVQ